jgi:hypothetical protein
MHRKVAVAIAAVLALGVASCGGSEKTTVTRAELVRQVELACRDGQRESQRQMRGARAGGRSGFIDAVLAGQRVIVDKIDDFETSGPAKADFEDFQSGMQARLDAIERIAAVDGADQPRAMRAAQPEIEAAGRKTTAAARNLGIEGCI